MIGFIRVFVVSLGRPSGHRVSHGFNPARIVVIWVRVVSLGCALGSSGLFGFAWVHSCAPKGRRVHWDLRGFTRVLLKVEVFIRVSVGSLGHAMCRWVHCGSLSFTRSLLGVVVFIQVCVS